MDGWTDGHTEIWLGRWTHGLMDKPINGWVDLLREYVDKHADGWTGRRDGWTERADGWIV